MNIDTIIDKLERVSLSNPTAECRCDGAAAHEAARILRACRAAGFIDENGKVRKVIRRVDVGRETSDYVDPVIDVMDAGVTVFICEAAQAAAAKEADNDK